MLANADIIKELSPLSSPVPSSGGQVNAHTGPTPAWVYRAGEDTLRPLPKISPRARGAALAGRLPAHVQRAEAGGLVVVWGGAAARRPGLAPLPPVRSPPSGLAGRRFTALHMSE